MMLGHVGYPSAQNDTNAQRAVCMWPGCRIFAVTELKQPCSPRRIALCTHHRRAWDGLSMRDTEQMPWTPRRKRWV